MLLDCASLLLDLSSLRQGSNSGRFELDTVAIAWGIDDVRPAPMKAVLDLDVSFRDQSFICRGRLAAVFETPCARCMAPATFRVTEPIFAVFSMDGSLEEDPSIVKIPRNGRFASLLDALREAVILSLPGLPLCREDCRGLCHVCGADLNEGTCEHTGPGE
ncbi:DUF177 domain-containing protein [Candidatus Fermentibacteria bacterium]|nr:DUF177 domain-containing protein [Candidatus Fermentibacteria bacterium]